MDFIAVLTFLVALAFGTAVIFGRNAVRRPPPEDKLHDNRFWTLFFNAFRLRCPVCKEGEIFSGWLKMRDACPHCGASLERGDGFYIGAIYFNYGATGILALVLFVVTHFFLDWPMSVTIGLVVVFASAFPLYFFRYGRASWLVFDQYFSPRLPPSLSASEESRY